MCPRSGFGTGEHPHVPSFRSLVPGKIRMYPRSGFWYQGTSTKSTLLETTLSFLPTPDKNQPTATGASRKGPLQKSQRSLNSVKTSFDISRQSSRRAKTSRIVKSVKNNFRHFSTIFARHRFSGPFGRVQSLTLFCRGFPALFS